jgi:predicted MFS family arabinose efflux permease
VATGEPGTEVRRRPAGPGRLRTAVGRARRRLDDVVGGPARRHVVLVLACVLSVAAADQGALSAVAGDIQRAFHVSETELGLLGSLSTGVSAAATLPFGAWIDRATRTRVLGWTIVVWAGAMVASGLATSYLFLLLARVALGVVVAVAYPATASVIGDYFPAGERGRIYGYVLTGELVGTGAGVAVAGAAASVTGTWRAAMFALAVPAAAVAWIAARLPEPARGGASRMPAGQREILSALRVEQGARPDSSPEGTSGADQDLARREVRGRDVPPRPELVLRRDPLGLPLPAAVRYLLRIRTNVVLIAGSALGYFFFSGLRFFAVQFLGAHYGIGRGETLLLLFVVGLGGLAGAVAGGRFADRLLRNGHLTARILVPAATFVLTALLLAPGILTGSLVLATVLFVAGAFFFAASNPPLDAARLDIVPGRLWGRAESVRSVVRGALEAAAPLTFGAVADSVFGSRGGLGLGRTFLVMLAPLVVSGFVLLLARRTYPGDVATADASEDALAAGSADREPDR